MPWFKNLLFTAFFFCFALVFAIAQRQYSTSSVLASGEWYKIAITQSGLYSLDLPLLQDLGLNVQGRSSSSIRVFGRGGRMLSERIDGAYTDDLPEIPLLRRDGGDGRVDPGDQLIFYAEGPKYWEFDRLSGQYRHHHNLYSDTVFYFITIGQLGKTMQPAPQNQNTSVRIDSYLWRYHAEKDSFNLLNSGKSWLGDEFSLMPGKTALRHYPIPAIPVSSGGPARVNARMVARNFGANSAFSVFASGLEPARVEIAPVGPAAFDIFAREGLLDREFAPGENFNQLSFQYENASINAQAWLDWFSIFLPAKLQKTAGQLHFSSPDMVGRAQWGRYILANASPSTLILQVTDPANPFLVETFPDQAGLSFTGDCSRLHEYIAVDPGEFLRPLPGGRIENQNLHASSSTNYLLITSLEFLGEASRIASFHRQNGLSVSVVRVDQLFNEFSGGIRDPSAIRDFVKMFYDRAGGDSALQPAYLLLFGKGSFDYKSRMKNNQNFLPPYESENSLDPLSTYTSDDFFGFLEDGEDITAGIPDLDIAVGRIPVSTAVEARSVVDKILVYHKPAAMGSWRNEISFIADDEDNNLHLEDAEEISRAAAAVAPTMLIGKIYLDAFTQEAGAGGSRYPDASQKILNKIQSGTLIWNYNGHGGSRRLAEETVLDEEMVRTLTNAERLPLFVVATCDFAPHDNPLIRSIGEELLLKDKAGAIALMSTTRLVFANANRLMNKHYLEILLKPRADGRFRSLGEAAREAKNLNYAFFGDLLNNRKFTLLGDPALTLAFPQHRVSLDAINGQSGADTLRAMGKFLIEGSVRDQQSNLLTDFDGTVYPIVFDKPSEERTRANDPGSRLVEFPVQQNILYKGKATVSGGRFRFEFTVPRDIRYDYGAGRMVFYAENGALDASGNVEIIVGGTGDSTTDQRGPEIRAFLNDETFTSGSIVGEAPVLILRLEDSSGINISGLGIGHDLTVIIDNDPAKQFLLNEYYEADKNDFRRGSLRFQLPVLEPGFHSLTVKAWDIVNNSSSRSLDFQVLNQDELVLKNVFNYPNPFTTRTNFWFDHNRAGDELSVHIQIFTVTGKLVKTLHNTIISSGNRSNEVFWNGRDDYGQKLARGVYVYTLLVSTSDGKQARKVEKLYLL